MLLNNFHLTYGHSCHKCFALWIISNENMAMLLHFSATITFMHYPSLYGKMRTNLFQLVHSQNYLFPAKRCLHRAPTLCVISLQLFFTIYWKSASPWQSLFFYFGRGFVSTNISDISTHWVIGTVVVPSVRTRPLPPGEIRSVLHYKWVEMRKKPRFLPFLLPL